MTYQRIVAPADLPPPGPPGPRAREKSDIDFKSFADEKKHFEHAKDIAAFANALGGVLIIGADDTTGPLVYDGLKRQTAADVKRIYESAAKACSPPAIVDVVPMDQAPGVPVVAVNVEPHADQAMASPAGTLDPTTNLPIKPGNGWLFPIRMASQTHFTTPDKLPMYMNREIRRAVLLLSRIPPAAKSNVKVHYHRPREIERQHWDGVVQIASMTLVVDEVAVELNRVRFIERGAVDNALAVPLLDVLDVWESAKDQWEILLAGVVRRTTGQRYEGLYYQPMPRRSG